MTKQTARERLARAAFELFDERGYEQTTVDDIADRAGVGRTTFFRHYRSKEEVIFPDHDRLLARIDGRLTTSSSGTALVAVSDAVRLVLLHYLEEGDLARRRYALTSKVPALRDREIASVARYQRLFREFIASWMGDSGASCGAGCAATPPTRSPRWTPRCATSSACSRSRIRRTPPPPRAPPWSPSPPARGSTRCSRNCAGCWRATADRRTPGGAAADPGRTAARAALDQGPTPPPCGIEPPARDAGSAAATAPARGRHRLGLDC
jgi:AcrR family transcriptional regulator